MNRIKIVIGDPQAQVEFVRLNEQLILRLENLRLSLQALADALVGKQDNAVDRAIYYLGLIVWQDFNEIMVLCGNGLENGAKKILRGMFERTVTAQYLHLHPDEARSFWNYYWVDMYKFASDLDKEFPDTFSKESLTRIDAEFQKVKGDFQVAECRVCKSEECQECKRTRTNHSWNKKDIVSMAKEVGMPLHVIKGAYYSPMMETHPKAQAILDRIEGLEKGNPDHNIDGTSLILAHGLILAVAEILSEHFKIDKMKKHLADAQADFSKIWKEKADRVKEL